LGCKSSRDQWEICTASHSLVGQENLAIWKAYKIEMEGQKVKMVNFFKALLESRIRLEY